MDSQENAPKTEITPEEVNRQEEPPKSSETSEEKFWHIKASAIPTDDPLLGCLIVLSRLEHKSATAEFLTHGLPLIDNKLTPDLFVRAANRINLSSQIVKRDLEDISSLVLPVVLLLKNRQACLLVGIQGDKVKIIQPETGHGVLEIKLEYLKGIYTGYAIFTRPSFQFDQRTDNEYFEKPQEWFWGTIAKILPMYSQIIVASLLINVFALFAPLFTMNVYDRVVPNNAFTTLWVLAIGIMFVYIFDFIMKMLRSYFIDVAGKKADILLSSMFYEQMIAVKMEARPESVGSFANNIGQFESFREFITSSTIATFIDLPFVVLFIIVIYLIAGNLILIPIVAIPIVVIASFLIQMPLNQLVKDSYRYTSQKQSMLIETLIGVEAIKTTGAASSLQRRWEHVHGMAAKYSTKTKILNNLATNFTALIQQITTVVTVIMGVYNISQGLMTMGALIAANMLISRSLMPLAQISSLITRYHQSMSALKSLDGLMKMPVDQPKDKRPIKHPDLIGNIEFKDVSFGYPNQDNPAINECSFNIRAGEKVGIIGRIGSGKTTIEKLIMNLLSPSSGSILFDGIDSKQLDVSTIRRSIGYVPQDVVLFYGTVRDNIVIGAPYVDDSAVLRAASISGVSEFVSKHPKGFDMPVGERGDKLSGGQRQSIAIARALLLDPKILVLDEPTNMMDSRSEEVFKHKLAQIIKDKTVIMITHKNSLLALVDRLIVIEDGTVMLDGPRDKVIQALVSGDVSGVKANQGQQS